MKFGLALLGLVALCGLIYADELAWKKFKAGRNYPSKTAEEQSKKQFLKNKRFVDEHNAKPGSFKVELNEFADKDTSQLKFSMGLSRPKQIPVANTAHAKPIGPDPKTFDWAEKGAVNAVQNQGHICQSCYAFAATGALEGQYFLKHGILPKFSQQSFIDCSDYGNNGCSGGLPQNVFLYLMANGSVNYQSDYKYKAKDSKCQMNNFEKVNITVQAYYSLVRGDETNLKNTLIYAGPIAMGIYGNNPSFQFYKSGVYHEPNCKTGFYDLDHAMLLTGYGETAKGEKYWIIKNSWGRKWGINGYFWLARDAKNQCGVATDGVYPVIL